MPLDSLTAVSAVDGRYAQRTAGLRRIASESALMRYRVEVEVHWLLALAAEPAIAELPAISATQRRALLDRVAAFSPDDAQAIKTTERTTNHDVKAVEYFVKEMLTAVDGLAPYTEFVHFACTSEDINSSAYALMIRALRDDALMPAYTSVGAQLDTYAQHWAKLPMLSRTHGQPASPTTLGKEFRNVQARLTRQLAQISTVPIMAKLSGAVGNYNAHVAAYPDVDWPALSARTLEQLGLTLNPLTTQIEPHDYIAELAHALQRANQVLIDLCRDLWGYIAIDYFGQKTVAGETGSSTMPHKVNPIDFENAEGNFGLANALLAHLAEKLPISRWQRDLSDSTVLRSLGTAVAHTTIALASLQKGLGKLEVNENGLAADLDRNWEVLGEAVQTVMRRYGLPEPYERIKAATRGKRLDQAGYRALLDTLELPAAAHAALAELTPARYLGLASALGGDR
ncbi:MAG: adenylosuccinate lyase [Pseudomonadota bacterium]